MSAKVITRLHTPHLNGRQRLGKVSVSIQRTMTPSRDARTVSASCSGSKGFDRKGRSLAGLSRVISGKYPEVSKICVDGLLFRVQSAKSHPLISGSTTSVTTRLTMLH